MFITRLTMYLVVVITITALLYKIIMRDGTGRVKQTITLQARRVNVVIINDNHTRATSTGNKTKDGASQQHVCQVEESDDDEPNEQQPDINDIVRNRIMGLLMHRHLINRLMESRENNEEGEYEDLTMRLSSAMMRLIHLLTAISSKEKPAAQTMMSNKKEHYDVLYQCGHMYR